VTARLGPAIALAGGLGLALAASASDARFDALGDLPSGIFSSVASAVSADGSVVVGRGEAILGERAWSRAWRWTREDGMVDLGDLEGGLPASLAHDVSADGLTVVGSFRSGSGPKAFVWNARRGMQSVRARLAEAPGLDLSGWTLSRTVAVSDDGRTLAGTGTNPEGRTEAWLAVLPGPR